MRLYKKCCIDCPKNKVTMNVCHVWNFVLCDGDEANCDSPELTESEYKELISKGGKIIQPNS